MRIQRRKGVSALVVAALVAAALAVLSSGGTPTKGLLAASAAVVPQETGSSFVGTWTGKRNPDDIANYTIRLSMDGGKLAGEALDVGKRQDVDKNKNLTTPRKVRESFVKLQSLSVNGTTLSFKVKDGKGRSQDATMKLVSDNEALVEFTGERRFPNKPSTTEPFSIRLRRE